MDAPLTFRVSPPAERAAHQGLLPPQRSGNRLGVSDRSAGISDAAAASSAGDVRVWCTPSKDRKGTSAAWPARPLHDTNGEAWSMPLAWFRRFRCTPIPTTQIIPPDANPSADLSVVVRSNSDHASGDGASAGAQRLEGRTASQPSIEFAKSGEHASEFKVLPDGAGEGRYRVRAVAARNGHEFSEGYSLVTRPDIGGFFYYQPAVPARGDREREGPARSEGRLHHGRRRRHSHCPAAGRPRRHPAHARRRGARQPAAVRHDRVGHSRLRHPRRREEEQPAPARLCA